MNTKISEHIKKHGVITADDLCKIFPPEELYPELITLEDQGVIEEVAGGIFIHEDTKIDSNIGLAVVQAYDSNAIICLLSALDYYRIGTQLPYEVWAFSDKAPITGLSVRFLNIQEPPRHVLKHSNLVLISGRPVKITTIEKTVVDTFVWKDEVGLDVFFEAFKETKEYHTRIFKIAEQAGVYQQMNDYLQRYRIR